MSTAPRSGTRGESGWAVFTGVLFALAGIFNAMWGIATLVNDDSFAASRLLFGALTVWGLICLVLGAAQLFTAWLIGTGRQLGRMLGILIIDGLAVHGDDDA